MILYECHIFNIWTCLIHIWDDDSGREMVQNWFWSAFFLCWWKSAFARTMALWVPDIYSVKSKK